MNKKKLVIMMASVALIGAVGIGATLAYFTDSDEATNIVTTGNVDISLLEDNEDVEGLNFDDVLPGQTLEKDPKVVLNPESADAFVRVKITISGNEMVGREGYTDEANALDALLKTTIEANGWKLNADGYYYYGVKLTQDDATTPTTLENEAILFDTLTIPTSWDNLMADKEFKVLIQAEAVQSDYLEDGATTASSNGAILSWDTNIIGEIKKLN